MADWDTHGLREFEADLGKIPGRTLPEAEKMLIKASLNVKTDARQRISGHPHAPAYPSSIGFDIYYLPFEVRSRIGPNKDARQGALGNILELGTVNNPPIPHLVPATDAEEPKFNEHAADLGVRLLKDGLS